MRLWLSMLAVTILSWTMRASGPLALGNRPLPKMAVRITGLMAPVLLAGLIIVELGGSGWSEFDWTQLGGVGVAGLARLLKAPMLMAVVVGIAATALLRLMLG